MMASKSYSAFLHRKAREYGERFSPQSLVPRFIPYYESNARVEVSFRNAQGEEYERKRGRIGVTTGWEPCFLLMLTRRSRGSSYILGKNDVVIREVSS